MHLIVFHYHLLPGGVTDVIVDSIRAVCLHSDGIESVRIVTARPDNAQECAARLPDLGVGVKIDVIPELDYTAGDEPVPVGVERATALERRLLADYPRDDALWWVHNYHLGKNPSFTRALCAIADSAASPRMLLHIHDFPECARYENLAYSNRIAGDSPYPASDTVRYAVINERDRRHLIAAGIPEGRVGLLLNPLPEAGAPPAASPTSAHTSAPAAPAGPVDRDRLVARLADFAADTGQRFHPDGPLLLYPVRTIRRKNVLEIASIARLVPQANLIVTLPGVSESERAYSDLVRYAYEDRRVHGIWGIGRRESEYALTYEEITAGADTIVSSSVQEGFGLLFVNALKWRKPLLARRLDVLEGIDSLFEDYPASFYDSFLVPTHAPSITSMTAYLRMRYAERLAELEAVIPRVARAKLEADLETVLAAESIDFSYLPAQLQLTVLGDLRDRGFGAYVRAMNADVIARLESMPGTAAPERNRELDELLGYRGFASRFTELAAGGTRAGGRRGRHEGVQDALVEAFAGIEQLRLLLGPLDHADHG